MAQGITAPFDAALIFRAGIRRGQRGLLAGAVKGRRMHRIQIDAIDTANIDGCHFRPIRHFAKGERFDTAGRTELVTNDVPIEKVFPCLSHTCRLRELGNR
ncbi:hypothetical protein [Pandoraea communis]|uniref:Uncharacterized protein n=1 Tax=Pandoraea communis TaxID=2508297 RepID=A0A5E4YUF8_9BURK|nr:hypothetical protein [Pandoraea communis]MDM8356746.1 hypothetical protein [Pandoraea communis]VVE52087.1 hypothetical protein PCO31111_04793 [Pandoraea communis]